MSFFIPTTASLRIALIGMRNILHYQPYWHPHCLREQESLDATNSFRQHVVVAHTHGMSDLCFGAILSCSGYMR
jgi:hypothetical protein